jgi:Fe2+ transport system protein FeoA
MKCSLCGYTFDELEASSGCASCGFSKGCDLVRCPNCGYEAAPDPKWIKRLFKKRRNNINPMALRSSSGVNTEPDAPTNGIVPLTALTLNSKGEVVRILTEDRNALRKLISIGVLPKTEIVLMHNFPSYVFRIGRSVFTIDEYLASNVYVRAIS